MTILLIIIAAILAILVFAIYRKSRISKQSKKLAEEKFLRCKFLYDKLQDKKSLTREEIFPYAADVKSREVVYQLLRDHGLLELFPEGYNTIVHGAESNLVSWLEFPTELDACPDEIEYLKRVTLDDDGNNNLVHYEVFKFRVNESHWAAISGWMLGVVGPYFDDSKPYDFPHSTFSRLNGMDKISPEEEVKWVHENISQR